MRGIYLWTNLVNNKKYVGKANDIASRKREYRYEVNRGNERPIIRALRKYGFENFSFKVIEEVPEDANILEREQYWMDEYDTLNLEKGYNLLRAKETYIEANSVGSLNNKAILSEEDVIEIRNSIFKEKQSPMEVYRIYKDKISWDAFRKAYIGETWKHLDCSMIVDLNNRVERKGLPKAKLTKEDVISIRQRAENGENINTIWKDYINIVSRSSIKRVINYQTWKNV